MSFKDYSVTPADNTTMGDGTYVGPNMLRNKVRPAFQQAMADGKELWNQMNGLVVDPSTANFIGNGVGAVGRTIGAKLRDTVSVKDFGATGDGTTDDTVNIQKALTYLSTNGGGRLFFSRGTYKISAVLTITGPYSVNLVGDGRNSTFINQATANAGIFSFASPYSGFSKMRLQYAGTPTTGATAVLFAVGSAYGHARDFAIDNANIAVKVQDVGIKLTQFDFFNYKTVGLWVINTNDVFISQFVMNAGNTTNGALGGIRLEEKAEAVNATDGDILLGAYSMTLAATTNALGTRPAYNKFCNVYFDSAANPVLIDKAVELDFVNCWFSNRPEHGVAISNSDGVRFSGGGAINCGKSGARVEATAVRVSFSNFAARGNSTTTANTYAGIEFVAGATDFSVTGCMLGGSIGFGSQKYGVLVGAGASDRYTISNNLVSGNTTGGLSDGGTGSNKAVGSNW